MGNRKKSQGKQWQRDDVPWIGLVWQVGLLTLFTYHNDSEVIIASLMNLSCAIVLLFFLLKKICLPKKYAYIMLTL
jgi:hypothetical protein